jgi:hypothetical protein
VTRRFLPGGVEPYDSSRGKPIPSGPEPLNTPGVPGSLSYPAGLVFTPEVIRTLDQMITAAIRRAFENYSIYTQNKPFKNFEVVPVPLVANTVAALDSDHRYKNSRVFFVVNPSAADAIWVNKTGTVAVNNGIPIATNFGSYMASMEEYIPHFAISTGANTAIVVWYF